MNQSYLQFRTSDGVCDGYVSAPSNGKNLPGIILYMDAIGLRPRICAMADRLAEQGYVVLAPNLFYRSGPAPLFDYENLLKPENFEKLFPLFRPMAQKLTPELAQRDNVIFLKLLRERPAINPHRIGALGCCMGGSQALIFGFQRSKRKSTSRMPIKTPACRSNRSCGSEQSSSVHPWDSRPKSMTDVFMAGR